MNMVKLKCGNFLTREMPEYEARQLATENAIKDIYGQVEIIPVNAEDKPKLYSIDGGRGK